MIQNPTSVCLSKELKISSQRGVYWYLHFHVHCSLIYNNSDMETALMSTSGWLDTEIRSAHTVEYSSASERRKFCHMQQQERILRTL